MKLSVSDYDTNTLIIYNIPDEHRYASDAMQLDEVVAELGHRVSNCDFFVFESMQNIDIKDDKCNMGNLDLYSGDLNFNADSWQQICDVVGVDREKTDKISLKFDKDSIKTNVASKKDILTVLKSADV